MIPVVVYHGAARWTVATDFQALFDLPAELKPYVPDYRYWLCDLSAYSDEEIKRTAELGVGLLLLKHIFQPDLRERLPEVVALWYTLRQQPHALGYLEAVIRTRCLPGRRSQLRMCVGRSRRLLRRELD